jgi:hypothetical protein
VRKFDYKGVPIIFIEKGGDSIKHKYIITEVTNFVKKQTMVPALPCFRRKVTTLQPSMIRQKRKMRLRKSEAVESKSL